MSIEIHEIIRSKRKTIALVVTADAKLVVRAPLNTPTDYIKSLVQKKKKWITEKQQAIVLRNEIHKEKQFVNGEGFLYLGDSYKLEISKDEQQVILKHGRLILPETELRTERVRTIMPDFEKQRKWLEENQKLLDVI